MGNIKQNRMIEPTVVINMKVVGLKEKSNLEVTGAKTGTRIYSDLTEESAQQA